MVDTDAYDVDELIEILTARGNAYQLLAELILNILDYDDLMILWPGDLDTGRQFLPKDVATFRREASDADNSMEDEHNGTSKSYSGIQIGGLLLWARAAWREVEHLSAHPRV